MDSKMGELMVLSRFGYDIQETDDPVTGEVEFKSRFRFRAEKWCDRMNRGRIVPSYRYEIFEDQGKYVVLAMQNVLVRKREDGTSTTSENRSDEAS